ncbi:MAG: lytic murein transglycosylase [Thermodesulfobacteriota bacterium]
MTLSPAYADEAPADVRASESDSFTRWLAALRRDAQDKGISESTLNAALKPVEAPTKRIIELDRNQPEQKLSLATYMEQRLTPERIARGKAMLERHAPLLEKIKHQFGVPPRFIVALWGLETSYGGYTGGFYVIQALATLAYDERRSAYFRDELLQALEIIDAGHIEADKMQGSWAGAMGQCQFMPSSFSNHAMDGDGDGVIDIWNSIPDVLTSAANYLNKAGWETGYTWGRKVQVPDSLDKSLLGLDTRMPLQKWTNHGVKRANGAPLPEVDIEASLLRPDGPDGDAWLVYHNFRVILKWNRSNAFGIAVGTLADALRN